MKKNEKKTMANKRNLQTNKEKTSVGLSLWATHGSPDKPLKIGNAEIPCYVLSNGMRILSGRGMQEAFGIGRTSSGARQSGVYLKNFLTNLLSRPKIKDLAHSDLINALEKPIRFKRPGRGGRVASGYEATIQSGNVNQTIILIEEIVLTEEKK